MLPGIEDQHYYLETQIRVPSFAMSYEHSHNYYEIFYLRSGACTYMINNSYFNLEAGDVMLIIPGDRHATRYEGRENSERIILSCRQESLPEMFYERLPEVKNMLAKSVKIMLNQAACSHLENILERMFVERDDPARLSPAISYTYLLEFLLLLCNRGVFSYDAYVSAKELDLDIDQALKYITQNYSLPLTLEGVAEQVNLSPTYFSRKIRQVTGSTFKEHLNNIRLKRAIQMLLTNDSSITEIALVCGFNSSNYFKDFFHKRMGISPRQYRKQAAHSNDNTADQALASSQDQTKNG